MVSTSTSCGLGHAPPWGCLGFGCLFLFLFVSLWRKVRAILYCPKKKSDLEVERITKFGVKLLQLK